MNFVPAIVFTIICAFGIFAAGVSVNIGGKPINMNKYRIGNIVVPLVFFVIVFLITNL